MATPRVFVIAGLPGFLSNKPWNPNGPDVRDALVRVTSDLR
jgi:hypothetical protein